MEDDNASEIARGKLWKEIEVNNGVTLLKVLLDINEVKPISENGNKLDINKGTDEVVALV